MNQRASLPVELGCHGLLLTSPLSENLRSCLGAPLQHRAAGGGLQAQGVVLVPSVRSLSNVA